MSDFVPYKPQRDEVIAHVYMSPGDELRFTRTDEEGMHWGYIYSNEHKIAHREMYILALGKYLEFIAVPGKEIFPPWEDDEDDE